MWRKEMTVLYRWVLHSAVWSLQWPVCQGDLHLAMLFPLLLRIFHEVLNSSRRTTGPLLLFFLHRCSKLWVQLWLGINLQSTLVFICWNDSERKEKYCGYSLIFLSYLEGLNRNITKDSLNEIACSPQLGVI